MEVSQRDAELAARIREREERADASKRASLKKFHDRIDEEFSVANRDRDSSDRA